MTASSDDITMGPQAHSQDLLRARREGKKEGVEEGMQVALTFLENAYLNDPGRPDRGTPKGDAILELARQLADHMRAKIKAVK